VNAPPAHPPEPGSILIPVLLAGLLLAVPAGLVTLAVVSPRTGPSLSRGSEEPRVRIALVEHADAITVELLNAWTVTPDVGEPLLLDAPGAVTIRWTGSTAGGLTLEGEQGVGFPGAKVLDLSPVLVEGPDPAIFAMDGRKYRGRLRIKLATAEGTQVRAINSVGIEDYLAGVIGHEMPLRWSDAALHVQAIAARTYALTNLHPGKDHDLKADTRSQVYRGLMAEDARARKLVDDTRGQVVTQDGKMVVTYFHSTCGGDTVPATWIFDWVKKPTKALSGATGCSCQSSRFYRWDKDVDLAGHSALGSLTLPLKTVSVDHWPRGEYVKSVLLEDSAGTQLVLKAWDVRRQFKLRGYSFRATLSEDGASLSFTGRGWGHGVGMCQFGAEGFATDGKDPQWILAHFYPGTVVEPLGY
jgi:stage II sporulation protein D